MSEISKNYIDAETFGLGPLFNERGHLTVEGGMAFVNRTGNFTPEQRQQIERHLSSYADCQSGLETTKNIFKK